MNWECPTCDTFNESNCSSCPVCDTAKPQPRPVPQMDYQQYNAMPYAHNNREVSYDKPVRAAPAVGPPANYASPKAVNWKCSVCDVANSQLSIFCSFCTASKPVDFAPVKNDAPYTRPHSQSQPYRNESYNNDRMQPANYSNQSNPPPPHRYHSNPPPHQPYREPQQSYRAAHQRNYSNPPQPQQFDHYDNEPYPAYPYQNPNPNMELQQSEYLNGNRYRDVLESVVVPQMDVGDDADADIWKPLPKVQLPQPKEWICTVCDASNKMDLKLCNACGCEPGTRFDEDNEVKKPENPVQPAAFEQRHVESRISSTKPQTMWDVRQKQMEDSSSAECKLAELPRSLPSRPEILFKAGEWVIYPLDFERTVERLKKCVTEKEASLIVESVPKFVMNPQIDPNNIDESKNDICIPPSWFDIGSICGVSNERHPVACIESWKSESTLVFVDVRLLTAVDLYRNYTQYFRMGSTCCLWHVNSLSWKEGRIAEIGTGKAAIEYGNDISVLPLHYLARFSEPVSDEWTEASEFVFKEYIRDVCAELVKSKPSKDSQEEKKGDGLDDFDEMEVTVDMDQFKQAMLSLGIRSALSLSRAFEFCQQIKRDAYIEKLQEIENNQATRLLLISEGHAVDQFKCIGPCNVVHEMGVCLTECDHCMCYDDFTKLLDTAIAGKTDPKCPQCSVVVSPNDIQRHGGEQRFNVITDSQIQNALKGIDTIKNCLNCKAMVDLMDPTMTQFVCDQCYQNNCLTCKVIHENGVTCVSHAFLQSHQLYSNWNGAKDDNNAVATLPEVAKGSPEWNFVVSKAQPVDKARIKKIQRVENGQLWKRYSDYAVGLGANLKEVFVWHGTRNNQPSLIYNGGFLKEKSRVGGCLWFAVSSSYSMGGYQHPIAGGSHVLFLSLVAGGNTEEVKYIRGNQILNVYRNEACYPGWYVTI